MGQSKGPLQQVTPSAHADMFIIHGNCLTNRRRPCSFLQHTPLVRVKLPSEHGFRHCRLVGCERVGMLAWVLALGLSGHPPLCLDGNSGSGGIYRKTTSSPTNYSNLRTTRTSVLALQGFLVGRFVPTGERRFACFYPKSPFEQPTVPMTSRLTDPNARYLTPPHPLSPYL